MAAAALAASAADSAASGAGVAEGARGTLAEGAVVARVRGRAPRLAERDVDVVVAVRRAYGPTRVGSVWRSVQRPILRCGREGGGDVAGPEHVESPAVRRSEIKKGHRYSKSLLYVLFRSTPPACTPTPTRINIKSCHMMADEYLDDRAKAYDLDQPIIGHELHWPPRQRRTVPAGLWLVHRKLYDLNSFVDHHPGGPQLIGLGRGSDATALVESYHALADRSKVDRVLNEFYVRDATEAETPLEAKERLEWSDCGFYRTLANRVAAVLTPAIRQQRRRNGLYACMSACVCLLWSTAVSGLADTDATSSYATRVMLPAVMAGLLLCCLLGAFHEAGHGALFDARCRVPMGFASMTANRLAAAGGTLLTGVSDEVFTESHAGDHHTHPNLPGADLDPEMWEPLLRKCSHAPWHPWHAYQHFFAPILYLASATALSLTHQRRLGASLSASLRGRMRRRGSATMARGTAMEAAGVADGGDDLWAVVGELMLIVAHWTLVALLPMGIALCTRAARVWHALSPRSSRTRRCSAVDTRSSSSARTRHARASRRRKGRSVAARRLTGASISSARLPTSWAPSARRAPLSGSRGASYSRRSTTSSQASPTRTSRRCGPSWSSPAVSLASSLHRPRWALRCRH